MANANEVLGLLHGLYGVGAVLSPFLVTSLITKAGVGWWYFYYIMVCTVYAVHSHMSHIYLTFPTV